MLIVDMKMPKRCFDCPMHDWTYGQHETRQNVLVCNAHHELTPILCQTIPNGDERPDWCPIKGELVTCGECNRHEEPRDTCLKAFIWCNLYNTHKFKDGYCNCGERKDGERNG